MPSIGDALRFRRTVDRLVRAASANARSHAEDLLRAFDPDMPEGDWRLLREAVVRAFLGDVNLGSDAVASVAAAFYNTCLEGVEDAGTAAADGSSRISPAQAEGTVRRLAGVLFRTAADGRRLPPDRKAFLEGIESYASKRTRESANETVERCVERSPNKEIRYQRVPTGAETCTYCAKLASRGAEYRSAATAGKASHNNCRCVAVPTLKGRSVEGCPKEDWAEVWSRFEEIDERGLDEREARALKTAALARLRPGGTTPSRDELSEAVEGAMAKVRKDFSNTAKNEFAADKRAYEETVGRFLAELGKETPSEFAGSYERSKNGKFVGANPSTDEIVAALSLADGRRIEFLPTTNGSKPDLLVGGRYVEVKTPVSSDKLRTRLAKAAKQLRSVGASQGEVVLDVAKLRSGAADAGAVAQRFVDDGTFSRVTVLDWPDRRVLTKR